MARRPIMTSRVIASRAVAPLLIMTALIMMTTGGQGRTLADADRAIATPEAGCLVVPLTYDELLALVGTRGPDDPLPELPDATAIPVGDPVDSTTREQIVATTEQWVACGNTGDSLRLLALYSDRLLHTFSLLPPSAIAALATPEPDGPDATLVGVQDVVRLPDGRVSAIVFVTWHPNDVNPDASIMIFAYVDGEWFLDEAHREIVVGDEIVSIADAIGTPTFEP